MSITNGRLDGVRYLQAHSMGGKMKPSLIVLHDTAGRLDKGSSVNWFRSKQCKVSAHFVVERDGTITQMVPCDRRAFHAGESNWNGRRYCNSFSIGIEIVNPGKLDKEGRGWFGKATDLPLEHKRTKDHGAGWWLGYTVPQLEAVKRLCRELVQEYPDCNEIVTHWMISPRRKIDTNPLMPLQEVCDYAYGVDEPEPEQPQDKPIVLPLPKPEPKPQTDPVKPVTFPQITKVSRKARWLSRVGKAINSIWISFSALALSDWLGYAKGVYDDVTNFISDHQLAIGITVGLLGAVVVRHVQGLVVEDTIEGRYVPSGVVGEDQSLAGEIMDMAPLSDSLDLVEARGVSPANKA